MASSLKLGKSHLDRERFVAHVSGGGAYGYGCVGKFDGVKWRDLEIFEDHRSGTKRSGYVIFDISETGLYRYVGIAVSNNNVKNGYFERTVDGDLVVYSDQQMQKRQIELFPAYGEILKAEKYELIWQARGRIYAFEELAKREHKP